MNPRGRSFRGPPRSAAFSILELLLVLALFGLIGSLVVGAVATMLRDSDRTTAEQKALSAIARARQDAVLAGRMLELTYDPEQRKLDWQQGSDLVPPGDDDVRFLPPSREAAMLVGGRLVESPLPRVRFYPDGTCDPFRLELVGAQSSRYVAIDPWTAAVLGNEASAKAMRR